MDSSIMLGKELIKAMSGTGWIVFGVAAAYCWRIWVLNEILGN